MAIPEPNTLGGNALILRSATGYSYYAHLSSYGRTGPVEAGAVIGYVGTSGDAKGLIRQLNDIHNRWGADYRAMRDTQSKLGLPKWDTPPMLSPIASQLPAPDT